MTQAASAGLLCPACKVDLVMTERKDVEIDYCPKCRGVWLDPAASSTRSSKRAPPRKLRSALRPNSKLNPTRSSSIPATPAMASAENTASVGSLANVESAVATAIAANPGCRRFSTKPPGFLLRHPKAWPWEIHEFA